MTKQSTPAAGDTNGWAETADKQAASFSAFQGPIVAMASQAFGRYFNGLAALNEEMTRFMVERLRYDAEFGQALSSCQTFAETAEMQQQWVRKAAEDYACEAKKLSEISQKVVTDAAQLPPGS